jgi:hypothetical protein
MINRRDFGRLAALFSAASAVPSSSLAGADRAAGHVTPPLPSTNIIESALRRLEIDSSYEIVISNRPDLVEITAAEMMRKFLEKGGIRIIIVSESRASSQKKFLLGRETDLEAIHRYSNTGELTIHDVSPEDDGFHLKQIDTSIVVAGANPRGVLYGVYAFEDYARAGAHGILDIRRVPYFRKRGGGFHYSFHQYVNLSTEDIPDEKAACLSRMGINEMTDQGIGDDGGLFTFVRSDVFSFQRPPRPDFQRKVRALSTLCTKYGMNPYVFLTEPALPKLAANLADYPEEALGTSKIPWGGDKDGLVRTLCVSSPIVRDHLQNMMRKFVREFPDLKGVQFYSMDGSSWLCTPELCPRCMKVCSDSPSNKYNPWETMARLTTLLAEAAHSERSDFDFRFWGAVHYHGEAFDKLVRAAQGYDSLMGSWNAADRGVTVPNAAQRDPAFLGSQEMGKERGVPVHIIHETNNLESVPRSLPFPFHVCDALKKFKAWNVANVMEIYGLAPEHNSINALVTKQFQWCPDEQPEQFLRSLSTLQFGSGAGPWMYRAWEEIAQSFDVWNDMPFCPLNGSLPFLSIGPSMTLPFPVLPDVVNYLNYEIAVRIDCEPWRADEYMKFKEKALLDKMRQMDVHLARAAQHAKNAVEAASAHDFIAVCSYEGVNGRPTCKEYAELNYSPIAIANLLCRQRCNLLRAYHLQIEIGTARTAGDGQLAAEKEEVYRELVREDLAVQESFCDLLTTLAGMRPCYFRTGLTTNEISDLLLRTRSKIRALQQFLETKHNLR